MPLTITQSTASANAGVVVVVVKAKTATRTATNLQGRDGTTLYPGRDKADPLRRVNQGARPGHLAQVSLPAAIGVQTSRLISPHGPFSNSPFIGRPRRSQVCYVRPGRSDFGLV